MNENKKAAVALGVFFSAALCVSGFTGKEEVLKTDKAALSAMADIKANFSDLGCMDTTFIKVAQIAEAQLQQGKELAKKQAEERAQEEARRQQELQAQQALQEAAPGAESIPVSGGAESIPVSGDDQSLLASIIFCEAGNQPYEGQVAVGAVVMNRVRSGAFPNTVGEVIYQPGQFTPAITGWLDQVRSSGGYTDTAMQAAADALAGVNPVGGCLYFDCGGSGMQIGDHYFH